MKRYKLTLGYLFILFVCTFSCRPEGEVVRANLQNFTESDQAKIGAELTQHIFENQGAFNLYSPRQNQEIYMYLNTVLSTIVNTMSVENRDEFKWEVFIVCDDENMSAFTLPGGKIFITSSFLKFIKSEAQLFSVLSHEMCYADHELAMQKLQERFSGLILGDIVFNNPVDEKGDMIEVLQTESYNSSKVLEADLYSIEVLCPFQYEAGGISSILQNVTDNEYPLEWLETRPGYEGRMDTLSTRSIGCGADTTEEARYIENVINHLDC